MTSPRPLALTDNQLALVLVSAANVPPERRHWYLENIADQLLPRTEPADEEVRAAIEQVVSRLPRPA